MIYVFQILYLSTSRSKICTDVTISVITKAKVSTSVNPAMAMFCRKASVNLLMENYKKLVKIKNKLRKNPTAVN